MKKLSAEKMKERIAKGYYLWHYEDEGQYELCSNYHGAYKGGVMISEERALEWIEQGIPVEVM